MRLHHVLTLAAALSLAPVASARADVQIAMQRWSRHDECRRRDDSRDPRRLGEGRSDTDRECGARQRRTGHLAPSGRTRGTGARDHPAIGQRISGGAARKRHRERIPLRSHFRDADEHAAPDGTRASAGSHATAAVQPDDSATAAVRAQTTTTRRRIPTLPPGQRGPVFTFPQPGVRRRRWAPCLRACRLRYDRGRPLREGPAGVAVPGMIVEPQPPAQPGRPPQP